MTHHGCGKLIPSETYHDASLSVSNG